MYYEFIHYHWLDLVWMDDPTTDYQQIVDKYIDGHEQECYTMEEVENEGWYDDEYVIGGNHSLALYTGGNLFIQTQTKNTLAITGNTHLRGNII